MNLDIEITVIKALPDVVCYLYSGSKLLDAISATNDPVITVIPIETSTISVVAKDLLTSEIVFKEEISVELLLTQSLFVPEIDPFLIFHTLTNTGLSPIKLSLENSYEFLSENLLELEGFREKEAEFLREIQIKQTNFGGGFVEDIKKLVELHVEYVKSCIRTVESKRAKGFADEVFGKEKEKELVGKINVLTQEISQIGLEAKKIKADNEILHMELEFAKNEAKICGFRPSQIADSELQAKKHLLSLFLENINRELIKKKFIQLTVQKELKSIQSSNKLLQSHLASLTSLIEKTSEKKNQKSTTRQKPKHRRCQSDPA